MNYQNIFTLLVFGLIASAGLNCSNGRKNKISIVPKPTKMEIRNGEFVLSTDTRIWVEPGHTEVRKVAEYFTQFINIPTGFNLNATEYPGTDSEAGNQSVLFKTSDASSDLGDEGYHLTVRQNSIEVTAAKPAGLFYAVQTIRQLLPSTIESREVVTTDSSWTIPCVEIEDKPRFTYRGMHLDVGRHFMPKEFILKYIDYLAMYKMNTFHWHLTEDQGWRIEIKKYPKLTQVSAWRKETLVGSAQQYPRHFDGQRHGGFYKQDEIREIVEYARSRFITIIPEIEMPGHSMAVLAAYPQLSCTGGPFDVRTYWGISDDVYCAGKEETFQFLQDVLSEVIDLFPSKYIHIGGDECPKTRWEECPDCQARIRTENLEDESGLQSYFIKRIEKFLHSKDRRLIGWDEILEGGLAPDATVMSWRGMEGGIAAAQQDHDVIMTPTSNCYFDYYQGDPDFEPMAIGGYTDLKKAYSFEPVPDHLNSQEKKHILGAQGNVWTEYIPNPDKVEYMVFPRIAALAEVVWTPADQRDWKDFTHRMEKQYWRYDQLGIHYSRSYFSAYPVAANETSKNRVIVDFKTQMIEPEIRYTLDGRDPDSTAKLFTKPFPLEKTTLVKAATFRNGHRLGQVCSRKFIVHKAVGKLVKLLSPKRENREKSFGKVLTDGLQGTKNYNNGLWQYIQKEDFEGIIDLGSKIPLNKISMNFIHSGLAAVFSPKSIEYAVSDDGNQFRTIAIIQNEDADKQVGILIKKFEQRFSDIDTRFIKIKAENIEECPPWHRHPGAPAFLLLDEIVVE